MGEVLEPKLGSKMVTNPEIFFFNLVTVTLLFTFCFNYSILYLLLFFSVGIFFRIVWFVSLWVGVIFFLIYIGALLVLFFFIFSLGKKYLTLPKQTKLFYFGYLFLPLLLITKRYSWTINSEVYMKFRDSAVMLKDRVSLICLIVFICLVLWCLTLINLKTKTPLRPFF